MTMHAPLNTNLLVSAGLASATAQAWAAAEPAVTADLKSDRRNYGEFWKLGSQLLGALPGRPDRNEAEREAVHAIFAACRRSRDRFLVAHAAEVYSELTDGRKRLLRIEELVDRAAKAFPGLVPSADEVRAESALDQRDKDGVEIDQGVFLSRVLADERSGLHLCHAMLLPRPESAEHAATFAAQGVLDLGPARLERKGKALFLTASNPRFLNAEDDTTLDLTESVVDVAILDPHSELIVLRGGKVEHPKYRDRRVFGAGINLTHLYRGKIPLLWYLRRDLAYVHKIVRGVAQPDSFPDDVNGFGTEKIWIAAVDTFAIGGHCQLLLAVDYVLAASDAFMTLPARKEGIIPGLANLRLPRLTGDRIAREAIQYGRKLTCDSPEGRLICDEIVDADEMDAAIERIVSGLTNAGPVSAVGNRRALRVGQEPIDLFRRYCAVYAREQAYCHFSPALIRNLERNWDAQNRKY